MSRLHAITAAIGLAFGLSGPVLADSNTGTINQTGTGNTASIDQTINVGSATSTINQNGDLNAAISVQSNDIYFGDTYPVTIWIGQTGSGNTATVTQDEAFGSDATSVQNGTGNAATINQHYFADYSHATIYQIGSGNTAGIDQQYLAYSSASVLQEYGTTASTAQINQGASESGFSWYLTATVEQFTTDQASATINQTGTSNTALAHQDNTFGAGVSATINQSGDHNSAITNQTSWGPGYGNWSSTAGIDQSGSGNVAEIDQKYVWFSSAYIGQWGGSSNTANIVQASMSVGNASINQWGDGNAATIKQGYPISGCCGYALNASISQTGSSNIAEADQAGWGSDASIYQNGSFNTAMVTQNGTDYNNHNVANISQIGMSNSATVSQSGAGNHATINQH